MESGSTWFWKNYKMGMDWIKRHEVAYWKSQALSYKAQNTALLQALHDAHAAPQELSHTISSKKASKNRSRALRRLKARKNRVSKSTQSESDVEVSSELLQYFQETIEHRKKLVEEKKIKEESLSAFLPPQAIMESRQKEMKELYGEGSAKILGMETAMTLAFDRYIDQKNPEYWPSLPLKMK